MKKIFLMMMAVGLVMSISACSGKTEEKSENKTAVENKVVSQEKETGKVIESKYSGSMSIK